MVKELLLELPDLKDERLEHVREAIAETQALAAPDADELRAERKAIRQERQLLIDEGGTPSCLNAERCYCRALSSPPSKVKLASELATYRLL